MKGMPPPGSRGLPKVEDRLSFIYLEHSVVHRDGNAITATDSRGTVHIPAASTAVLMLGPGTSISHQAIVLVSESRSSVIWVGEAGVRFYAHGKSLARSSRLLEKQAKLVSNQRERLAVARKMYEMRFPGEDVSRLSMQQLRGREGARVRKAYSRASKESRIAWDGRVYNAENFEDSNVINQALSAAHASLYGVVHAVIVALGCSPGLGFVHCGHERSFVFDIADLYKTEISIPLAFRVSSVSESNIGVAARHGMRDLIFESKVIQRCVKDIKYLLGEYEEKGDLEVEVLELWDERGESVLGGSNYSTDDFEF